jgi:hypothetical protein
MSAAAVLAITLGLCGSAAQAQYVQPSQQRSWVPGHWEWNGWRNEWVNGYYLVQPLEVRPQGFTHRRRDQDRDGIPDRLDRDRDGDGVPNRFDRRPSDPWRR